MAAQYSGMKKLKLLSSLIVICCLAANAQDTGTTTLPDTSITGNIPIISLSETELEMEDELESISGVLSAGTGNDTWSRTAAFNWGAVRFRPRGYYNNSTEIYINGANMNDLETGGTYWSAWGGLNDVFRYKSDVTQGLDASEYTFGGLNGSAFVNIGAHKQDKRGNGLRLSYANTNRNYSHRLMATWNPTLKNGWALSLSASRRWAEEGYIQGTFYDAYSYFVGVEKKYGNHTTGLTFFGAPNRRGKQGAAIQEMYDIAGTNYYNPYWGYQNGDKRNSRVAKTHQPVAILHHIWEPKEGTRLQLSGSFQSGRNGSSRLDWQGARDPRPDYYRYLPSYVNDPQEAQEVWDAMAADENLRQIDWEYMYNSNRFGTPETIMNANGVEGNNITGLRSKYIVSETRYDKNKADFNAIFSTTFNEKVSFNSGAYYRWQKTHNHNVVDDLLGGEYWLDVDNFVERDFPDQPELLNNDIRTPNKVLGEGDTYGYSYYSNINKTGAWAQTQISLNKFDFFLSGNASITNFWRTGNFQNGRFPDSSLGESEKQNFLNFGAKAGATYKINGRNYLYANGGYMTRPPSYREAYLSPRTRDELAPGLTSEKVMTTEGGFIHNSPNIKVRLTGYFTEIHDGINTMSFYHDSKQTFVNYTVNGIDRRHFGLEYGMEADIVGGFSANAALALGQYYYTSRPTAYISQDNSSESLTGAGGTVYQKNFYIPNSPQQAYSAGVKYSSPKFWFATLTFNVFNETYLDFNPDRRTAATVEPVEYGTEDWETTINQERLKSQYTLDLFFYKSFKLGDNKFASISLGMSNILNNREIITGGFEQLRFDDEGDPNRFPNKYYYAYGTNYFAGLTFRL